MTMGILNSAPARILAVLLVVQGAVYYAVASRADHIPQIGPLSSFPAQAGDWVLMRDLPVEKEVGDVLRADDILNRIYTNPNRTMASLFVAFFKTQRYGQAPHSPKNCLPGAGWQAMTDARLPIAVRGRNEPIVVNKYVIARGDQAAVVLYWYQSRDRAVADELTAKLWLVADAVRYHRSDTALIRILVPVADSGQDAAERAAIAFLQAVYPELRRKLPA